MLVLSKLPELEMSVAYHKNITVIIYRSETVICFHLLKNLGKTVLSRGRYSLDFLHQDTFQWK